MRNVRAAQLSCRRHEAARISAPPRFPRRSRGKAGQRPRNSEARPARLGRLPRRCVPQEEDRLSPRATALRPCGAGEVRSAFGLSSTVYGADDDGIPENSPPKLAGLADDAGRRFSAACSSRRGKPPRARRHGRGSRRTFGEKRMLGRGEPARHVSRQAPGDGRASPERATLTRRVSFPLRAFVIGTGDRAPETARSRSASVPMNGLARRSRTVDGAQTERPPRRPRPAARQTAPWARLNSPSRQALRRARRQRVFGQSRLRCRTPRSDNDRNGRKSAPRVSGGKFFALRFRQPARPLGFADGWAEGPRGCRADGRRQKTAQRKRLPKTGYGRAASRFVLLSVRGSASYTGVLSQNPAGSARYRHVRSRT